MITADTERLLMSQCRLLMVGGNTTYAGAVTMQQLVIALKVIERGERRRI